MLTIVFVLNFIACIFFSMAMLQRYLPDRAAFYAAFFESFGVACLFFSVEIWFVIEGLSLFNALKTPEPLAAILFLVFLAFAVGIFQLRKSMVQFWTARKTAIVDPFIRNFVILIAIFILLPLIFVAVFYPPCTADSMSYHLSRVVHWIQNGNVALYPSNYPRQIYYQPFAEYLLLPWNLLSGGDFFDNLVQIVAQLGIFCLTALLVQFFGGNGRCQLLACLLVLSSPIVIFEMPTTQTDLVLTFFFFSFLYFGLKLSRTAPKQTPLSEILFYAVCMGTALGLGLNTKVSIAAFEIPFCLWFGWRYWNVYRIKVLPIFCILFLGFFLFNIPYYTRNIQLCGNIYGSAYDQKAMVNARFGHDVVFSNAVRNIGMQLRIPNQEINRYNKWFLIKLHHSFGMAWGDYQTTFMGSGTVPYDYETVFILDDYRSGNMLIILLFCIVAGVGMTNWSRKLFLGQPQSEKRREEQISVQKLKKCSAKSAKPEILSAKEIRDEQLPSLKRTTPSRELTIYVWLIFFGFLFFSGLFRWQPFGTRLQLPCFLGSIPYIAIGLCAFLPQKRIAQFIPLLFGISFLYVLFLTSNSMFFNPLDAMISYQETPVVENTGEEISRELSLNNPELFSDYIAQRPWKEAYLFHRKYGYFRAVKQYMVDYISITNKIDELGSTKIGLALDTNYDRWDYPFSPLLNSFGRDYRFEWVIFPEFLKNTPNYDPNFVPELIITDFSQDLITQYFDIEHAWKYEHLVLLKVKGKNESNVVPNSKPGDKMNIEPDKIGI